MRRSIERLHRLFERPLHIPAILFLRYVTLGCPSYESSVPGQSRSLLPGAAALRDRADRFEHMD